MRKRYPVRRSELARAARFIAALGMPTLLAGVLAHRAGVIGAQDLANTLLAAVVLGLTGVAMSCIAITNWWNKGGIGVADAVRGLFYGLIMLAPAGAVLAATAAFPPLTDVSTDLRDPPSFAGKRAAQGPAAAAVREELQRVAYPDIVSRRFRISPSDLHAAVLKVIEKERWTVLAELPPDMRDAPTLIEAKTHVPVVAIPSDLTIRVRPDRTGALLDVRARSELPNHDLGLNAWRIRGFYRALDETLTEAYGDIAKLTVTAEEAAATVVEELPLLTGEPQSAGAGAVPLPSMKPAAVPPVPGTLPGEFDEIYEEDLPQG
ncbi:MAG: DUF1499 domain-containing protein [Pannonibacter sp.]